MEINGYPIIFMIPAVSLVLLTIAIGIFRFVSVGANRALVAMIRVMIYGGFAFFVLVMSLLVFHYSTGGH